MYGCKFIHLSHECVTTYRTPLMLYSQMLVWKMF